MRLALSLILLAAPLAADPAQITAVEPQPDGSAWRFSVTILHPETGWDDYADGWRVELPDGTVLGTRVLHHPHENEQPFTRSLSGVAIPEGIDTMFVRAKTSVEGWGEQTTLVALTR